MPEIVGDAGVDSAAWILVGLAALVAVLLVAGWLHSWWTNLLRNYVEAKRRLRGRDGGVKPE